MDEDYFSYALFAFYIFKEEDGFVFSNNEMRLTEQHNNLAKALKSGRDTEAVRNIKKQADTLDLEYLRYSRRIRNMNVWYKALFLYVVEISMIWFVIQWYQKSGLDYRAYYGTYVLKYCCIVALHLM